jgi:hypothetical protein
VLKFKTKIPAPNGLEQIEVRERLLSFTVKSFAFQLTTQKYED